MFRTPIPLLGQSTAGVDVAVAQAEAMVVLMVVSLMTKRRVRDGLNIAADMKAVSDGCNNLRSKHRQTV